MIKSLVLGFTMSDRERDYSSFDDGYDESARQQTIVVFVDVDRPLETTPEMVASLAYEASNCPAEISENHLCGRIQKGLDPFYVRSLSIGDTVTYAGVKVALEKHGLRRVN